MSDWLKSFFSQFGDGVTTDTVALAIQGVPPACVCSPESEAQAAAMIRFTASHKIPVVPLGGGTSQDRIAPPPPEFLALSTKRLNKLVHHEPGDMVATVQAGMTLNAFQDAMRKGGQWLPIDAPPDATIGGIVAANTHGPRAHGYGTLRDMILGMTVINGDGVIRKCGGKVVKNVTGYALDKMYIGSFGTLGLITEITFKLRPLATGASSWMIGVPNLESGCELLLAIAGKNLPLDLATLMSPAANTMTSDDAKYPEVHILATGTPAELERIDAEIQIVAKSSYTRICTSTHPLENQISVAFDMGEQFGRMALKSGYGTKNREGVSSARLRFGCVRSKLKSAISILEKFTTAPQMFTLHGGEIDLTPLTASEAARIASEFEKVGINFAFENIVGLNIPNRWGSPRPEWAIMKQLKSALDPQGILNPGRFVV